MPKFTLAKRIDRVSDMIKMIVSDFSEAIEVEAALDVGNGQVMRDVGSRQSYHAHVYNAIHRSLLAHLILILNRICDQGRGELADQDKASIPVVLAQLESPDVVQHWQDVARAWHPGIGSDERNAQIVSEKIAEARQCWWKCRTESPISDWLDSLRRFRNGRVAHSLVDYHLGDLPKYHYLSSLRAELQPIVKDLRLAIEGVDWDYEDSTRIARGYAEEFWTPVTKSMLGE
jgi:HEPN superfamily AbiU2-like protein